MTRYKVGYFVGSLAKASINRKLAVALVRLAPEELELTEISFKDLPLYSYGYDADQRPRHTSSSSRASSPTTARSPTIPPASS